MLWTATMALVRASADFICAPVAAEALWYDTDLWPSFIDGCARIVRVDAAWPQAGAEVVWESTPAGRGRVLERVERYEPALGQTSQVSDDASRGVQRVAFEALDGGVGLQLEFDYQLESSPLLRPLLDALFVRRAQTASLERTLERFGRELVRTPSPSPPKGS